MPPLKYGADGALVRAIYRAMAEEQATPMPAKGEFWSAYYFGVER
jgi:hypothetical protein